MSFKSTSAEVKSQAGVRMFRKVKFPKPMGVSASMSGLLAGK